MLTHPEACWRLAPSAVSLPDKAVHLWLVRLDLGSAHISNCRCLLSSSEIGRSEQFRHGRDSNRFIAARSSLRIILGRYLELPPDELEFRCTQYGKPELAKGCAEADLRFNVSHSEDYALYGITRAQEIGVDIEHVKTIPEANQMAGHFFSPNEKSSLDGLSSGELPRGFFRYWTRKEAFIKARGQGLSFPLDRLDVSTISGETGSGLIEDSGQESHWSLLDLSPAPGYVAAVVVDGYFTSVCCWKCRG